MNVLLRGLSRLIFATSGWKIEGQPPAERRYVIIAAPHTSNWDGFLMVCASYLFGVRISWFVKDNLFFWPLGPLLRGLGGIPIDRRARHGVVEQIAGRLREAESLVIIIPPEGSRSWRPHWKTGFYHIAMQAEVPLVLGYVDFGRKVAGLGPLLRPSGDMAADFQVLADFYRGVQARFPAQVGPVMPPQDPAAQ